MNRNKYQHIWNIFSNLFPLNPLRRSPNTAWRWVVIFQSKGVTYDLNFSILKISYLIFNGYATYRIRFL